jgi:hypothetical protein
MYEKRHMPEADAPFIAWLKNIGYNVTTHKTAWGISEQDVNDLSNIVNFTYESYQENMSPELKNRRTSA